MSSIVKCVGEVALLLVLAGLPQDAFGELYRYDLTGAGWLGIEYNPNSPHESLVQSVAVVGTAEVDFGPEFFTLGSRQAWPETAVRLDLWLGGAHLATSGSVIWEGNTRSIRWGQRSFSGVPLYGGSAEAIWDGGVNPLEYQMVLPDEFHLGAPGLGAYDYPYEVFTRDAWLFGESRFVPTWLTMSNPTMVPEPSALVLFVVAFGCLVGARHVSPRLTGATRGRTSAGGGGK